MISDHLNGEITYKMVEANCDARVMNEIAEIIEKYKDKDKLTKKNTFQVFHITQVICMASLKLTNLNQIKIQSKNNKKSMYILLNH